MKRLEGKVALISGTARGQGRAAALRFAAEGAIVISGDLRHESALETQRLVAQAGGTALTPGPLVPRQAAFARQGAASGASSRKAGRKPSYWMYVGFRPVRREGVPGVATGRTLPAGALDATDEDSVRAWVEEAADAFGCIDILYADAGAVRFGAVDTQPYEDFGCTMRAEPASVWLAAHVAWPHLVRSRGCIVTVGSTAGLTGSLTNQRTALPQLSASLEQGGALMASKGAVIAMTRQPAAEGAPYGIRANCVSPGVIDTEATRGDLPADDHSMRTIARHIPLGRVGLPDEVVNAAVFLVSDETSYTTGANLVVDGGWLSVLPG